MDAMIDDDLRRLLESMQRENAAAHAETRRHFDIAVEDGAKRFDQLAESIVSVHEELQRTRTTLEEKVERSAAKRRR